MREHLTNPYDEYDFSTVAILKVLEADSVVLRGITPQTIWPLHAYRVSENLDSVNWIEARKSVISRTTRNVMMTILSIALSCTLAVPVTFSATLGQIEDLTKNISWLFWVRRIPPHALAYLQGAVPQLLVAGIVAFVPSILKYLSTWHCYVTHAQAEIAYYRYYSAFLFLQAFLLVAISSNLMVTLSEVLNQPSTIPRVLALNLPKAGNYFISYLTLQGFSLSADMIAQWSYLLKKAFRSHAWNSTPRHVAAVASRDPFSITSMYSVVALLGLIGKLSISSSTHFPKLTQVGTIYSIITPLALIPSSLGLFALLVAIKPALRRFKGNTTSTNGEMFLSVIHQLFLGLYIMQLCLAGIFISVESKTARFACKIQAILTMLLFFSTCCFHFILTRETNRRLQTVFLPNGVGEDGIQEQTTQDQSKSMAVPPLLTLTRDPEIFRDVWSTTETPKIHILQREASRDPGDSSITDRMRMGMVPHIPIAGETLKFYLQITLWLGEKADCTQSRVRDLVMDEFEGLVTANNSLKLKKMMVIECSSIDTPTKFR
jgi:hypothetical protein